MKNSIQLFQKYGVSGRNLNYSEASNAFLSDGYTSSAGNTYFNSVRLAEGVLIKEDVGQGYCHTFLNGLRIYSLRDKTLIAEKNFHCTYYSKYIVREEAKSMLFKTLKEAAKLKNVIFNENEVEAQIMLLLDKAFSQDQRDVFQCQVKHYLS